MKNKRDSRLGEMRKNKEGLTMRIIGYSNNKNVTIEFVETGEVKTIRYSQFVKGSTHADLLKHPSRTECSFRQAIWITISMVLLLLGIITFIIYAIVK